MSLILRRHIGVADVKLAKLYKVGVMEFKPPESCQSNYRYLQQGLLSIQAFIQALSSTAIFFPKIEFL